MINIKALVASLMLFFCSLSAYADVWVTYDFSGVSVDQGQNIVWPYYNQWFLGVSDQIPGRLAGWMGEKLEQATQAPFIVTNGTSDNVPYIKNLAVGLTHDQGVTFTPVPTPPSCLVNMQNGDVLYISGILHIPGKFKEPYIENLSCKLN